MKLRDLKWHPVFFLFVIVVGFSGCTDDQQSITHPFESGEWIDLTYDFSEETLYWPTAEGFRLDTVTVGYTDGGFYYESFNYFSAEHGGTHLDAPIHFSEGSFSTDEIPLEDLMGEVALIDVSEQALENRDYQISVEDIQDWEEANGHSVNDKIILVRTGFGQYWPDPEQYMGTYLRGEEGVAELSFPGLDPAAAQWLVDNRSIKAFGLDTPSIDYGRSTLFESHQILFGQNIPAFENVANLDQLPATGVWVIALPMKIRNGSGGPLRIVAHLP